MLKNELINAIIEDSRKVILPFEEVVDEALNNAGVKKYSGNVIPKKFGSRSVPTTIEVYVINEGLAKEDAWDDRNIDWDFKAAIYNKINTSISNQNIKAALINSINYEYAHANVTVYKDINGDNKECKYLAYKKQDGTVGFEELI